MTTIQHRSTMTSAEADDNRNAKACYIASVVCWMMGIDISDVSGDGRVHGETIARELVALIAHDHFGVSYPQIAVACGKLSYRRHNPLHSTFISAANRARRKIASCDTPFVERYHDVCRKLGETPMKFEEAAS